METLESSFGQALELARQMEILGLSKDRLEAHLYFSESRRMLAQILSVDPPSVEFEAFKASLNSSVNPPNSRPAQSEKISFLDLVHQQINYQM